LLAILFSLAGGITYFNALSGPFHFDDRHGIVENHYLRDADNIPKFFSYPEGRAYFAPSEPQAKHYRPLLLTSYAANFHFGGESTWGFHLYNLALHVAGALLITALGIRLGLTMPWAVGVGLVFLLHPLQTEAVNYITARSSLQSGVLTLGALYTFARARQVTHTSPWPWLGLAGVLTLAAVLTKEVAVTIPLMFLAYDLFYPPPKERRWGLNGYGLDLLMMGLGLAFLMAQQLHHYFLRVLAGESGPRGMGDNLWLQAQVLLEYIRLTLLPVGLSIVHDANWVAGPSLAGAMAGLTLAVMALVVVLTRRKIPLLGMGLALFLLVLLPTTILPMNTPLQESRGYAAIGGILLALGAVLATVTSRFRLKPHWRWVLLPLACLLAMGTMQRNTVWQSDLNLWADAVKKAPGDYRAHSNLGSAYHAQGNYPAAIAKYRDAIKLYGDDAVVYTVLGGALLHTGELNEARATLNRALATYEAYAPAHHTMAMVLERQGEHDRAMDAYRRALELVPSFTDARVNLGILMARGGNLQGAAAEMKTALKYDPRTSQTYVNLMTIYVALRAKKQARELYDQAIQNGAISPHLERAYAPLKGR
jgi:Tfp pilus assembly protein PilF